MNKWILISPMLFGLIACGSGADSETRFEEQLLGQWEQPCTPQQGNSASKMTMELSISKAIISQVNYSDSSCEFSDIDSSLHGSYTVEPSPDKTFYYIDFHGEETYLGFLMSFL